MGPIEEMEPTDEEPAVTLAAPVPEPPAPSELASGEAVEAVAEPEPEPEPEAEPEAEAEPPAVYHPMRFVDVAVPLPSTTPVVLLQEVDPPGRLLRIPIGLPEGSAIAYAARSMSTPRPLTHELMTSVLEAFGLVLEVVRLTEVRGSAFSAEMVVTGSGGSRTLTCRPSDGIALALRHRLFVPVVAAARVLEVAGVAPAGETGSGASGTEEATTREGPPAPGS